MPDPSEPNPTAAAHASPEGPQRQADPNDVLGGPHADASRGKGFFSFFRELPVLILIAFALAMLIKTFLVQAFYIPSESMLPTLEVGDRVLVNKLVYRFREPRRGEIIVFIEEDEDNPRPPRSLPRRIRDFIFEGFGLAPPSEKDFIKRVIGLPGETVQVRRGRVTVTTTAGERIRLEEPYAVPQRDEPYGPERVPEGEYFVMGDNRPNSADSRTTLGTVARGDIVGRAFVRIWPVRRLSLFRRPKYEPAGGKAVAAAFAGAPGLVLAIAEARRLRRRKAA